MSLTNVVEFLTPRFFKPGDFRSLDAIRRDCFTPAMRADYLEHEEKARDAEATRNSFTMPSNRLKIGLAAFRAKSLAEVPAAQRERLERACVAHEKTAVLEFDREVLALPLRNLRPVRDRLQKEFNERMSAECDREADTLSAALHEVFAIYGHADAVETGCISELDYRSRVPVAPVRELRNAAKNARDALAQGCPFFGNDAGSWEDARRTFRDVV